jgi:hypothetical protein
MNNPTMPGSGLTASGYRSLAWIAGGLASVAAAAVGVVLAVVFAASLLVIAIMALAVIAFALMAARARRALRRPAGAADNPIIEAHNVGGHSWVAYGWDRGK